MPVKYVVVSGGVISGVGKGLTASSIGAILKDHNLRVTAVKIDPYLNVDSGTFSPIEHGEVFVLNDGGEMDLDLGNYERFLDTALTRDHNITTGKIYQGVIKCERRGDFLGKTVQVVPHITNAIQEWIERVATKDDQFDVCIVEMGGVVGDIEGSPFVEALRQMQFRMGSKNFFVAHLSMLPESGGELKTKPTQMSIKELRAAGLIPNMLICRTKVHIPDEARAKLSLFSQLPASHIIEMLDCSCLYEIPLKLFEQKVCHTINDALDLGIKSFNVEYLSKWSHLASVWKSTTANPLKIAIVGKYVKLHDSYHSVERALRHSCLDIARGLEILWVDSEELEGGSTNFGDHKKSWDLIKNADGIVIPGGFGSRGVEGKIVAVHYARINSVPILGICLGLQTMVIEACRNLLHLQCANSTEFDTETCHPVIINMEVYNKEHLGASMRLGEHGTKIVDRESHLYQLYDSQELIYERHRHRYEVNLKYQKPLEENGFKFVGFDSEENQVEMLEYRDKNHPYFVGVQFHPEFKSRPLKPSPPFFGLVKAACAYARSKLPN